MEPYLLLKTFAGSEAHSGAVLCLAFSPDGAHLASGAEDGLLIIWDVQDGKPLYRIDLQSPVSCLSWNPHCSLTLFCGCDNGSAYYIDDLRAAVSAFIPSDAKSFNTP
jgi:WD40 repeat protein